MALREARHNCTPVPTDEIIAFVHGTILPAIDAFNGELGRSKGKMKHPRKLKTDAPGVDGLWHFVGELRRRIEIGRAVPGGLLDMVVRFAEQFKADYTPLTSFSTPTAISPRGKQRHCSLKRMPRLWSCGTTR